MCHFVDIYLGTVPYTRLTIYSYTCIVRILAKTKRYA